MNDLFSGKGKARQVDELVRSMGLVQEVDEIGNRAVRKGSDASQCFYGMWWVSVSVEFLVPIVQ